MQALDSHNQLIAPHTDFVQSPTNQVHFLHHFIATAVSYELLPSLYNVTTLSALLYCCSKTFD